jgi:hypothetical protein
MEGKIAVLKVRTEIEIVWGFGVVLMKWEMDGVRLKKVWTPGTLI